MKPGVYTLFYLIGTILLLSSCTPKEHKTTEGAKEGPKPMAPVQEEVRKRIQQVEKSDFEGNLEKYGLLEETGNYEGRYTKLRADGSLIEEAYYNDGAIDGLRILYYPTQDTQIVETHVNGLFHGPYRSYYKGNRVKLSGEYNENQMQGIWYKYYETGEIMEEVTFVDNLENGPFTEYHLNGQISVQGTYLDGDNEDGELKFFTEEGVHYKTMNCNKGMCRTTWRLENETTE
ncbi:MAG: hypothetical protein Sapg2KO_22640 [Saprospiraceae bacterium]